MSNFRLPDFIVTDGIAALESGAESGIRNIRDIGTATFKTHAEALKELVRYMTQGLPVRARMHALNILQLDNTQLLATRTLMGQTPGNFHHNQIKMVDRLLERALSSAASPARTNVIPLASRLAAPVRSSAVLADQAALQVGKVVRESAQLEQVVSRGGAFSSLSRFLTPTRMVIGVTVAAVGLGVYFYSRQSHSPTIEN